MADLVRPLFAFLGLLLVACGSTDPAARSPRTTTTSDAPVEFLLASAAADFHAHRPPYPARLRNVRIGSVSNPEGNRQYMLCGSFLPVAGDRKAEWMPFATIKTSGYEQWIGAQALNFCSLPSIVWLDGDFSSALQARLDSAH